MAKSRHDFSPRVLTVYDHPLRPEVVVGERGYLALVFSAQLGGRAEELDGAVATEAAGAGYLFSTGKKLSHYKGSLWNFFF